MGIIRRTIKAVGASVALFILLTLLSAVLIYFTDIRESWNHVIMMVSMVISGAFAGVLEAKIVGRRMLFVFLITAILFMAVVYGSLHLIFTFK